MAIEYDILLRCKSNPELLETIDPKELIDNTPAEFISYDNYQFYFQGRGILISDKIQELAKKHPDEEFIAVIWNIDAYESVMKTVSFKGKDCFLERAEPKFYYDCPYDLSKVIGEKVFCDYVKKIKRFFESIKDFLDVEWDEENPKNNNSKVISIQLEDENFRVIATRECYSLIRILGYYKDRQLPIWKALDENSDYHKMLQRNKRIDDENDDEYNDLPF